MTSAPADQPSRSDPPPASGTTRRLDIQGLRAVAVGLVVVFHTGIGIPGGFLGVDVFFVISGFVIARILLRELRTTGTIRLSAFYSRRVRRLLPALAVVLVFVVIGSILFQSPVGLQQQTSTIGSAASVFLANAALYLRAGGGYFDVSSAFMPLLHTWTLAVEEQFYLFFPLLLLGVWKLGRRRSDRTRTVLLVAAIVAVILVSLTAAIILTYHGDGLIPRARSFAFFGSPTRAWQFALGALIAIGEVRLKRLDPRVAVATGVVGIGLIAYGAFTFDARTAFPGYPALVPTVGAALVIIGGTSSTIGVPWLLSRRPLVWIGDVSYGWYLWHWPVIVFTRLAHPGVTHLQLLAVAVASLIPTWLSYRFVENPIRMNRRIIGPWALALAGICVALPFLGFRVSNHLAKHPSGDVADVIHQRRGHLDLTQGCAEGNLPDDPQTAAHCTFRTPDAVGTVLLVGDSNAGQFAEPVVAAAHAAHRDVVLATAPACLFGDVIETQHSFDGAACRTFVAQWTDWVADGNADLVILGNNASRLAHDPSYRLTDPRTGRSSTATAGKAAIWGAGLDRSLGALTRAGTPVIVVHTVPQFGDFDLRTCPGYRLMRDPRSCGVTRTRSSIDAFAAPTRRAETDAVARHHGVRAVDFTDQLCSSRRCSTNRGRFWVYRDGGHLSVGGAETLTPTFERLLRQQLSPPPSR